MRKRTFLLLIMLGLAVFFVVLAVSKTPRLLSVSRQVEPNKIPNTKSYAGNKITLLVNGVNSNEQRIKNIKEADTILIKTFEFRDDETGNDLIKLLAEKAKSGAKIFIQFDVNGTRHTPSEQKNIWLGRESPIPSNLEKLFNESRGRVFIIPTNVPERFFNYFKSLFGLYIPNDHQKYLITWNSRDLSSPVKAILGGLNIGDEYMFGGVKDNRGKYKMVPRYHTYAFRDTDVQVIGAVVQDIIKQYIDDANYYAHNQNKYYRKYIYPNVMESINQLTILSNKLQASKKIAFPDRAGQASVSFIVNSRGDSSKNINETFSAILDQLPKGTVVKLVTPLFLPTEEIQNKILSAANNGVKFSILTSSLYSADSDFARVARASHCRYRYLIKHAPENAFEFYEWNGNENIGLGSLHQKVYSFGESKTAPFMIGSLNLDYHSLVYNAEDVLLIQDQAQKILFDQMLAKDYSPATATRWSASQLENESLSAKFLECFDDWVFHRVL